MAITISGNGIVEANLADNAVTLAKMASGTDGEILTYDASGNPVAVSVGTDGQVLTSTGAGSPPAFETAAGADNTPACAVTISGWFNYSDATLTKLPFASEIFDTDSAFDSATNYRFTVPSGKAGKYYVSANAQGLGSGYVVRSVGLFLYVNGSRYTDSTSTDINSDANDMSLSTTATLDMAVGDYVEVYIIVDVESGYSPKTYGQSAHLSIFKLAGV